MREHGSMKLMYCELNCKKNCFLTCQVKYNNSQTRCGEYDGSCLVFKYCCVSKNNVDNGDKPTSVLPGQETSRGERETKLTVFKPLSQIR